MMAASQLSATPLDGTDGTDMTTLARKLDQLDIHVVEDGYVVYHQAANRVHYLNATAAMVLELCDGTRTDAEIAADTASWFSGVPVDEVDACLTQLRTERLVA
jgi:hypothetical protein